MAGLMNGALRIISLRFVVQEKLVPSCLREKPAVATSRAAAKTPGEFMAKRKLKGARVIDPVCEVGCVPFRTGLAVAGYVMVDAFSQPREDGRYVLRFDFADLDHAVSSDEFQKNVKPVAEKALGQLFEEAMWQVEVYLNHYFEEGRPAEDEYAVSVNFGHRFAILDQNGHHILQWAKDEHGERIGDAPVKVKPKIFLKIEDGGIALSEIGK
jgi:hypothetical protein